MAIKVVKKDKAKVLYSRIKNSSGADLTIDGQTLPDGEQVEEGKPNSAGFRFKFIKPRYIETSGNTIVDLMHFGRIPRSQSGYVGLLNEYPNAAFAASVRLLDNTYTGGLVRVRAYRVIGSGGLDQGEADVLPDPSSGYFISLNSPITNLDATATGRGLTDSDTLGDLLSSGASNYDGFVTTWYDQSGNGNDAVQATASNQPQIVSGGALITENGKPSIDFDGVDDFLLMSYKASLSAFDNALYFTTVKPTNVSQDSGLFQSAFNSVNYIAVGLGDLGTSARVGSRLVITNSVIDSSGYDATATQQLITTKVQRSLSQIDLYENGTIATQNYQTRSGGGVGTPLSIIGAANAPGGFYSSAIWQEHINYEADVFASQTAIETNINKAFTIYP